MATKYDVANPGLGLRHAQNCCGVKSVNGSPTFSLDNCILNSNTYMYMSKP